MGVTSRWPNQFSSVQSLSCVWLFATHDLQHTRPPCRSPIPKVCPNSCPSIWWCYPAISSSVVPFSSPNPSSNSSQHQGLFQGSQFFTSGGQCFGASISASVLPMNIQDWSPLGLTGLISLQSKGLSRAFSNSAVQKHQFFSAQLSLWSTSHIHITGKTVAVTRWTYISIRVQMTSRRDRWCDGGRALSGHVLFLHLGGIFSGSHFINTLTFKHMF